MQAKLEYEEVQRNFINDHANDDPDDEPVKFTALDIIDYIETECLCTNEKALQSIQNAISKMVRYNNQTLRLKNWAVSGRIRLASSKSISIN